MMISDQNLSSWAEKYRNNQLSPSELEALKKALQESEYLSTSWKETLSLLDLLDSKSDREKMRQKIQSVAFKYKNSIGQSKIEAAGKRRATNIIPFINRKNIFKLTGIAAALVIVSTLITFFITSDKGSKNGTQYTLLRREIENIKHSQSKLMDSLNHQTDATSSEPIYGGTGFALTNNGYIATNYHVVKDAHSIVIQTADNKDFKAYVVAFEPNTDVAILKIEDSSFRFGNTALPYRFTKQASDLGQKVFTMGYPQDNLVYNEGYISCEHGFDDDSTSYQLEMVANPGQSGAPVLDQSGNVVALVTGKQSNTSGTTFAVHAQALLELINSLPNSTQDKLKLTHGNSIKSLPRVAQVNRIRPYICSVKVN